MKPVNIVFIIILLFLLVSFNSYSQESKSDIKLTTEILASNFLKLYPDSIIYPDQRNSKKWNYEQGLIMEAFYQAWNKSGRTDRKSTRLNSSHLGISYAVFCLKKKKSYVISFICCS